MVFVCFPLSVLGLSDSWSAGREDHLQVLPRRVEAVGGGPAQENGEVRSTLLLILTI